MQDKIKFGVCGFGNIGKRHAEEISANPNALLTCIADTDEKMVSKAKEIYSIPVFSSLDEMLDNAEVDIVNICIPNGLHISSAVKVLRKNIHVLIEKPLTLKSQDCDMLSFLANVNNLNAWCVLQNRYSPMARHLKELIDKGSLGEIYFVNINCYWNRDDRYYSPQSWRGTLDLDGGTLYTQFSHFVDLVYWFLGDINITHRAFSNKSHPDLEIDDNGFFSFEFMKNGSGLFSWSTSLWDKNMESSITIIAEKGTVKMGGQYMERIDYFHVKDVPVPDFSHNPYPSANLYPQGYSGSANNHALVIENCVNALLRKPYELVSADEAAASVKIIESVYTGTPLIR